MINAVPLPQDLEAEKQFLAAVFATVGGALDDIGTQLQPCDFYKTQHQLIFKAILAVKAKGNKVDSVTVANQLNEGGELEKAGGYDLLFYIIDNAQIALNPAGHAEIIKNCALKRDIITLGSQLTTGALNGSSVDELLALMKDVKTPATPKIEIISLAQIIEIDPQIEPIAEGFINRGEPVIIHAAGGVGKSTLAHQMAEELAKPVNMYGNKLFETFPIRQTKCQSVFLQSENSMATINAKSRSCDPGTAGRIWYPRICDDIITTGGVFDDDTFIKRVIDTIKAIEDQTGDKVDLLFVDPLISFNRADENGAGDMRAALDGITQVMQQTEVTPIVLHHDRKEGDDYRGSTAINDWCRCRVHLKQKFIGEDRITDIDPDNHPIMRTARIPAIEMTHSKANNMPLFEPFTMTLNRGLKFIKVPDPIDPDVKEKAMIVQQALKDIGGSADSNVKLAKAVSDLTGKGVSTCKSYIAKAVEHKFIISKPNKAGDKKANAYSYILSE